jgi:predicted AlkP superfamily pyrophosphatase or phosphodiesterase
MAHPGGLVIIHVDGLAYHYLQQALAEGRMPFTQQLIRREGYEAARWRCGIPSTTPYIQAGLMFGDNRQIPSFRWWDKEAGRLIVFGGLSSFKYVSDKYFQGTAPLLANGAAIATCYTAEAVETYRLSYLQRERLRLSDVPTKHPSARYTIQHMAASWVMNPGHVLDMLRVGIVQIWKAYHRHRRTVQRGSRSAVKYLVTSVLEEIFLHQMTRHATIQAMRENYPIIYSAFYSYDGIAHALGPESPFSMRGLVSIDRAIERIARQRTQQERHYELLLLSDHGQTETIPYVERYERSVGQRLSEWLPSYEVREFNGKEFIPPQPAEGRVVVTYSGGLAHIYFPDLPGRLDLQAVSERFPGLVEKVAAAPGIEFVMMRDGTRDLLITPSERIELTGTEGMPEKACSLLQKFDQPDILARQLQNLNSFERSGDLIVFGAYDSECQINFENQIGGHGSIGGEQLFPFLLSKPEWGMDAERVADACDLYPQLVRLRDRLVNAPQAIASAQDNLDATPVWTQAASG